jgi:hypothetical protein
MFIHNTPIERYMTAAIVDIRRGNTAREHGCLLDKRGLKN